MRSDFPPIAGVVVSGAVRRKGPRVAQLVGVREGNGVGAWKWKSEEFPSGGKGVAEGTRGKCRGKTGKTVEWSALPWNAGAGRG